MKLNTARPAVYTHEGGRASVISPIAELERSVLACVLWEDSFYESGQSIADRILSLSAKVPDIQVQALAVKARTEYRLRHAPLLLVAALAVKRSKLAAATIAEVIQRPDELGELVKLYWHLNGGKKPLSAQIKKGLAKAFAKFDAYQLAKYSRDAEVKLRDVMFLTHPKPKDEAQAAVWKKLAEGTLESPDTWEVALSGGADKRETFERLIRENKLGYMALLRNLRNMAESGVNLDMVRGALMEGAVKSKALPFRFIAAARAVPQLEDTLDQAMQAALGQLDRLPGYTALLIDVSGSMFGTKVSAKSDMDRADAACALAILARGVCERVRVFTFSQALAEVPPRAGMALRDAIIGSQSHGGTYLKAAGEALNKVAGGYDRIIVVTDEQSHDGVFQPSGMGYMINVGSYEKGVGYGPFTHITGFSESVVRYIQESEKWT